MIIGVICNGVKFCVGIGNHSDLILLQKTFASCSIDCQQPTAIGKPYQLTRNFVIKLHESAELRASKIEHGNRAENGAANNGERNCHSPAVRRPGDQFSAILFWVDV